VVGGEPCRHVWPLTQAGLGWWEREARREDVYWDEFIGRDEKEMFSMVEVVDGYIHIRCYNYSGYTVGNMQVVSCGVLYYCSVLHFVALCSSTSTP
jgi:hypothetical protein